MPPTPDFQALVRSAGLDKIPRSIELTEKVYASYRQQLDRLLAVDLEGDEVQTAYQQPLDPD